MFQGDQYQLLDFGGGRRLERFAAVTLDRPCPAAEDLAAKYPDLWQAADARFERGEGDEGRWSCRGGLSERWTIAYGRRLFELKRAPLGQVGLFPEQAENWDWLGEQIVAAGEPLKVLNLFAYTGGSTLAAAAAGAEVFHVDAARNTNAWARHNAGLSGMADATIHWITEDALKFVNRELRRSHFYDAVILDPPSYGHGPRGEVWRLSKGLPRLLSLCGELTTGRRQFMLLTCHTPGFDPPRLKEMMSAALGPNQPGTLTARQLTLRTSDGRQLPSGVAVCWEKP